MKESYIEDLAYDLTKENAGKSIFFLGAGASVTGDIPLAKDIIDGVLRDHSNDPRIKRLKRSAKLAKSEITYAQIMECLTSDTRNELLSRLIEEAKINATHIYLAQLIKKGFVDYVLTVNFDNLMLRALALFDIFPPVYDLSSPSDFTTTRIKEKSIIYLHGQHQGKWLLNTSEEMAKVSSVVKHVFDKITHRQPWVILGYSGDDPIFEHIRNLGCFDNRLYWVGYNNYLPSKAVQDFLKESNTNAHIIKGYDADAFMMKLNTALELPQPDILDKPFTLLKTMLLNIVDIDDEHHFIGAKVRLEIARKYIDTSIDIFEDMKDIKLDKSELAIDKLRKDITDLITSEKYDDDEISKIELLSQRFNNQSVNKLLGQLYFNIGNSFAIPSATQDVSIDLPLFYDAVKWYRKAIVLMPDFLACLNNLGSTLTSFARTKKGPEADALYEEALATLKRAFDIEPDMHAINNWGIALTNFANTKKGPEADALYEEALAKYKLSFDIKLDNYQTFYGWGNTLSYFARTKTSPEADKLYKKAFAKYKQALDIEPDISHISSAWGLSLSLFALTKKGTEAASLYEQACAKYKQALDVKPDSHEAINNWGMALMFLKQIKTSPEADKLYKKALAKYKQILGIKPN